MHVIASIVGIAVVLGVLLDAFETMVLPRRVQRAFRLTSVFYRNTWVPWARFSRHIKSANRREAYLSYFGPFSLIVLLVVWATGLIFGYALVQFGIGGHVRATGEAITFPTLLYHSGETFFTLGYGDIVPDTGLARALAVLESGNGFAFLGIIIGYLPVVYSSFSRRELQISLLDARAGSPPSAAELLNRLGCCPDQGVLDNVFRDWEAWAAEVLEGHLSYPVLCFFRSQHSNQSWQAALTVILDVTALVIAGIDGIRPEQARLTFAMARHAAVDLAQVVNASYVEDEPERLPRSELERLRQTLAANGLHLRDDETADKKLAKLRSLYEPYMQGIVRNLLITIPPWIREDSKKDNWQTGPWDKMIQQRAGTETVQAILDDHF
jgi:Ion channel